MELSEEVLFPALSDTFRELAGRWTKLAVALEKPAKRKRPAAGRSKKK
jgi:hypothetical protein